MATKRTTARVNSAAKGLVWGCLSGLLMLLIGCGMIAKLAETETMEESWIGYGIVVLLILVSFVSALISYRLIMCRRLAVCMASGGINFGILLFITALFFDGQYRAVGVTALLIVCGSLLAVLPGLTGNRGGKRKKIRIPNG